MSIKETPRSTLQRRASSQLSLKKDPWLEWEWARKLYHSSVSIIILTLYRYDISTLLVLKILFAITLLYMQFDYLRFLDPSINISFIKVFGFGMRREEKQKLILTSSLYYLLGACSVLLYFGDDREIAFLSLLMLALGDTAASFGGRFFTRYLKTASSMNTSLKAGKKTLAGSFSAFLAGGMIMFSFYHFDMSRFFPILFGGLICAIGEYIDVCGLDDNLTMPITCAILIKTFRPFIIVK
jgi:diacylglycerol kinase (CTP)